jgi:outer membrane protein OmpA-like peptidoglycan-associated protein
MVSPYFQEIDRELEDEIQELLAETAGAGSPQRSVPARSLPTPRPAGHLPRRGPLLLGPEVLKGRPFLQINYFAFDKSALTHYQLDLVERAAQYIEARSRTSRPIIHVRLVGHTDSRGPASYNVALGQRRAAAVRNALMASIERRRPGLGKTISFTVQSAGVAQPIRREPSPAGPGLNRRVTVYLTARPAAGGDAILFESSGSGSGGSASPIAQPPALSPKVARPCCILAPVAVIANNIADPANVGTHNGSDEKVGLIYSGKAGFMDLGHIRDMIDITKFIFDQISAVNGRPATIKTAHGEAKLASKLPSAGFLGVARQIANDDGFGYEILTYWMTGPGTHNSSFSPEDLCSNNLGTLVAERAILAGGNFNAAATNELNALIKSLDGEPSAETLKAFKLINNCWITFGGGMDVLSDSYLRRRNFAPIPWKAGHPNDKATPAFVTALPGTASGLYQYTHTFARTISDADFPKEVAAIRKDASDPKKYGPKFDQSKCP